MKKIIILFLIVFLLTGCNVQENIIINKNLSVTEEVIMTGTKKFFDSRYKMLPINVIKDVLTSGDREKTLKQNNYNYRIDETGNYPSVIATKEYSSISDFTNSTIFKSQYFKKFTTEENNNLITILGKDFIKYDDNDLNRYSVTNCQINIKLPYKVTDNNADKYDAKTNTYTWYIDEKTENKEIKLTFDKTKLYIYNLALYISIVIVLILIIIGIYFVIKIKNKNNLVNQI